MGAQPDDGQKKGRAPRREPPFEQEPGALARRLAARTLRLKTSTRLGRKNTNRCSPRTNEPTTLGRHREDILYKNNTTLVREENKNKVKKPSIQKKKKKKTPEQKKKKKKKKKS